MVTRDSQFSRKGKTTREAESGRSVRSSSSASHSRTGETTLSEPANSEISNVERSNTERSKIERSQSWQVAPNLFTSFKYAWAGISYAFNTQRNFRIHTGLGITAMFLCWGLDVGTTEIAIVCLTIGAVLVMEILNTALESLVDLTVGQTYHELAKVAKDCAAGAVLMAAIVALLVAALIFVPPISALLWGNLSDNLNLANEVITP